jgi:transketolase
MMRAVHGSTVLYPADGNCTVSLVAQMVDLPGISYIRTTREKTPALYPGEGFNPGRFPIGGSKVLREGDADRVTIVGAGVTVFEALKAADTLGEKGVSARVVDAYSVKPIDARTVRRAMDETGLLVVVEDHWIEGGLGDAVLEALASGGQELSGRVIKLAVTQMPGSGTPEELRERAGISADKIVRAVRSALSH